VQTCQLLSPGGITDELVCKVCYDVVGSEPRLTKCAHLFCGDCLSKWFTAQPQTQSWAQRTSSNGLVPCPVCKEPLHEDRDLFTLRKDGANGNGMLWSMLQQTQLRCINHSSCSAGGVCNWTGDYGSYQAHIRECKNELLQEPEQTQRVESVAFKSTAIEKAIVIVEQGELDGADSDSTWSDFLEHDNGEGSSDGDFTSCDLSDDGLCRGKSADSVTSAVSQGAEATLLDGRVARKSVRFQEDATLVEEIFFNVDMTPDEGATEDASASKGLVSNLDGTSVQLAHQVQHTPAETAAMVQQKSTMDMQKQHAALQAQQIAQWQHAQLAYSTYAAQWQTAQMQYAARWQAAQMQYAAQLHATHMQMAASAAKAAALGKKSRK